MENSEIVKKIYMLLSSSSYLRVKQFKKGEVIANFIRNREYVYILLNGEADLVKYLSNGDEMDIERYNMYDYFGDIFHDVQQNNEMMVFAKKNCSVIFFDYDLIQRSEIYQEIGDLMFRMVTNRIKEKNKRDEILLCRTTRDKLLMYLRKETQRKGNKVIDLDMNYTALAKYLNVDRSAMTRELFFLEEDGFIKRERKRIYLLT